MRQACRRATKADIDALNRNIEETRAALEAGNFALRAEKNVEFHRILAQMTRNPIMVIVMNGVLDVLRHFISKIGSYDNAYVLPSRVRFMKHFAAGDADAAVAEMELCLKKLQRSYMSRIEQPAAKRRTKRS